MNTVKQLILVSVFLPLFSCSEDRSEVDKLRTEVFGIHDEVMPKMDKLMELREAITHEVSLTDSILKIKEDAIVKNKKTEALAIGESLDDADSEMMDWMRNFKDDSVNTLKADMAVNYLKSEKIKIEKVRDKMLESISKAEKFTDKNP